MSDHNPGISLEAFDAGIKQQQIDQGTYDESATQINIPELEPENISIPAKDIYAALADNEDGDSALAIRLLKDRFLYDQRAGKNAAWHYWNDHYWREDEQNEVFSRAKEIGGVYYSQRKREEFKIEKIKAGKKNLSDKELQEIEEKQVNIKRLRQRETALQTLKRRTNVLQLASMGIGSLGYVGDSWDQNPWLIGCKNGVFNLKTGEFRAGKQDDYIKTVCPIEYDANAECPQWEKALSEIFDNDEELICFVKRLIGYAMTGLREEHIYPIFCGPHGRNGKGTIFETLKLILGQMAYKAPTQLVMQGVFPSSSGPNSMLMKLRGARAVWSSEANKKDHLDTAVVKGLSGGDTITARNPFDRKETDFSPTHTIFIITNHLPRVDADDEAFWDRVILVPFNMSFVDDPIKPYHRQRDKKLESKLKKELAGIFNWATEGTSEWKRYGLMIPESLKAAKLKYQKNEDIIGHFVEERLYIDETNKQIKIKPKELFNAYADWCKESGFKPLNQKHFHEAIQRKIEPPKNHSNIKYYIGVVVDEDSF